MRMHRLLRKIERAGMDPKTNKGGKPIATALPGTAAGIGLRIAPLRPTAFSAPPTQRPRVGLPEILVGIFPGGGRDNPFGAQTWFDGCLVIRKCLRVA